MVSAAVLVLVARNRRGDGRAASRSGFGTERGIRCVSCQLSCYVLGTCIDRLLLEMSHIRCRRSLAQGLPRPTMNSSARLLPRLRQFADRLLLHRPSQFATTESVCRKTTFVIQQEDLTCQGKVQPALLPPFILCPPSEAAGISPGSSPSSTFCTPPACQVPPLDAEADPPHAFHLSCRRARLTCSDVDSSPRSGRRAAMFPQNLSTTANLLSKSLS